jgi:hypothetical protein
MHSHARGLDNPKFANDDASRSEGKETLEAVEEATDRGPAAKFQNNNTRCLLGRKTQNLAKVAIQRDQRAAFRDASPKYDLVCGTGKPLFADGHRVVASLPQKIDAADADILVDLDPHIPGSTGSGIIRSREASAP